ncbi:MAG: hypothetical protein K0Q79_3684 [Flavipsychrobacter sp.]|nr:hypothetical protein [Flavipsychrobacter sp.]
MDSGHAQCLVGYGGRLCFYVYSIGRFPTVVHIGFFLSATISPLVPLMLNFDFN